jgi:small ligand-binding sensory domain FIST
MKPFPYAHAGHPQWQTAAALVLAQLRAQMATGAFAAHPTLALLYITDHYAESAEALLQFLGAELPLVTDWSGTVGLGIAANDAEYFDEPALAVMLMELPSDQYRVFSGVAPLSLGFEVHSALVHADPATTDLAELVEELAQRTDSGYLFGGLSGSRSGSVQFAIAGDGNIQGHGHSTGVFRGGLSGVAFGPGVALVSRVTQGCKPVGRARRITQADHNVVVELDRESALDVMLQDLSISLEQPRQALDAVRATLVGLSHPAVQRPGRAFMPGRGGDFGEDVTVRHIIGLDPARRGIAIAERVEVGMDLAFCQRNRQAASADLVRICAEIREELESPAGSLQAHAPAVALGPEPARHSGRRVAGAVYVSCSGRGGPHFGSPGAEMRIVRKALGDVPLVGFFASGEIAHHRLYGYTGVLTVFTAPD